MSETFVISKLDAIRRQAETAVSLHFKSADILSIHTLTAAAYDVLQGVLKHAGKGKGAIEEGLAEYVRPGFEAEFIALLRRPANFLKHADRDPEAHLRFSPRLTEIMLLTICLEYPKLTGETPLAFRVFAAWWQAKNPKYLKPAPGFEHLREELEREARAKSSAFADVSREDFYAAAMTVLSGALDGRPR